jgi:metal-dependent amidase/aminoacylase/carboxypeptidase family protein
VYGFFQAAEETGEGAKAAVSDSRFSHLDVNRGVFGLHNLPGVGLGHVQIRFPQKIGADRCVSTRASTGLTVQVTGRRGHAAEAQAALSPVPVIAELAVLASSMDRCAVVGLECGGPDFGVSPGDGRMYATLRADTYDEIDALQARLSREVSSLLDAQRARLGERDESSSSFTFSNTEPFKESVNTGAHCRTVATAANQLDCPLVAVDAPFPWSEDCGVVIDNWACGGCFFGVGSGVNQPPLHDSAYDFPDDLIDPMARLWMEITRTALTDATL